jgi:hypothetical protein
MVRTGRKRIIGGNDKIEETSMKEERERNERSMKTQPCVHYTRSLDIQTIPRKDPFPILPKTLITKQGSNRQIKHSDRFEMTASHADHPERP